jgi:hypothetical protein
MQNLFNVIEISLRKRLSEEAVHYIVDGFIELTAILKIAPSYMEHMSFDSLSSVLWNSLLSLGISNLLAQTRIMSQLYLSSIC